MVKGITLRRGIIYKITEKWNQHMEENGIKRRPCCIFLPPTRRKTNKMSKCTYSFAEPPPPCDERNAKRLARRLRRWLNSSDDVISSSTRAVTWRDVAIKPSKRCHRWSTSHANAAEFVAPRFQSWRAGSCQHCVRKFCITGFYYRSNLCVCTCLCIYAVVELSARRKL